MPIILGIYVGPYWDFARNHLNISIYNGEIFKPVSIGQQQQFFVISSMLISIWIFKYKIKTENSYSYDQNWNM